MNIEILIRKRVDYSPYIEKIERLIEIQGDKLIITTGYINNSSTERYNTLAMCRIGEVIKKKLKNNEIFKLTILGGYGEKELEDFIEFCKELNSYVANKNFELELRYVKDKNWNGKVAIKYLEKEKK